MAGVPPQQLRQDELPEYPYVGPFGGISSEMPLDKIGRSGFAEVQNILFRKSTAQLVGQFQSLGQQPLTGLEIAQLTGTIAGLSGLIKNLSSLGAASPIMGIADFFDVNGTRHFVVMTPTSLFQWIGGSWQQINGTMTGTAQQYFSWDVVGYTLYFSQQKDVIWYWNGLTAGFSQVSGTNAVAAKYLCELNFQLLAANCIVSGGAAPNAMFWSGIANGQDWTSYSSGSNNLFNGLGPINGLARIYQAGYAFQQWGITQITPTGIGTSPFAFIPLGSRAKGSILPYGVATFGEIISAYVGKDNIYTFDGTESNPIGSRSIDGNRQLGARQRIFTDLYAANLQNIFGFINTSNNGIDYESYWLLIPSLNKAWIYHFDEGTWTQMYFNTGQLQGPVGIFSGNNFASPEIIQLVGTIAQQSWSFESLDNVAPLDTMAIADANALTVSLLNPNVAGSYPTSGSINKTDGWYVRSGQLEFDDPRHNHSLKKVRVSMIDHAPITINFRFTNENGQQATWPVPGGSPNSTTIYKMTYGTGSGATLKMIIPVSLQGKYITWEMSGPPGVAWGMSEITPIYDVSGEVQNAR